MKPYDSPFAAIGDTRDTREVAAQVGAIIHAFSPGHDLTRVAGAFRLLDGALDGGLPGYQKLKTLYHNRIHINEVVLCAARVLHGLHLAGLGLDADHIDAALLGALMHDIGYLMKDGEDRGTGAQFTDTHVLRGVEFVRTHLSDLPPRVMEATVKVILLTDHRRHPDSVKFDDAQQQRAAFATATADLTGQMANREYLERLLFLYFEFEEAKMGDFVDIHDLLERTTKFYAESKARLEADLGGLGKHLALHFKACQGSERNFYAEAIERNIEYLARLVHIEPEHRLEFLKRGGVVEQVLAMTGEG